jgi:serine/threonine protein kinase
MLESDNMKNYVLGDVVGRGGMGQVFEAHTDDGRPVVVKRLRNTLHGNLSMTERLDDEASLLTRIQHHNVVRVVDRGRETGGTPYLVMEHAGTPLGKLLDDAPLALTRAYAIASQMLAGLAAIHEAGVVHADIKSSNVLVDENDRVVIIDFGLARPSSDDIEFNDTIAGTPAYMSPEVIGGATPTIASDIYSAGIVLYEMFTGVTPFSMSDDIFGSHLREPVVPPSMRAPDKGISVLLDRVIDRALAKKPEARFATVRELAAALDNAAAAALAMTTIQMSTIERPTLEFRRDQISESRAMTEQTEVPALAKDDVIVRALDRARVLVEGDEVLVAIAVLESALAALAPEVTSDLPLPADAWRIETVLAALYNGLGKKERARRLAMSAYKHALRSGCKTASARTLQLLERIAPPNDADEAGPRRFARGSARFRRVAAR